MKILILGYPRGWHRYECLKKGLTANGHNVDVVTEIVCAVQEASVRHRAQFYEFHRL
jgi:hypothetical protein